MQPGGSAKTPWPWLREWELRQQRDRRHSDRAAGCNTTGDHGCAKQEVTSRVLFSARAGLSQSRPFFVLRPRHSQQADFQSHLAPQAAVFRPHHFHLQNIAILQQGRDLEFERLLRLSWAQPMSVETNVRGPGQPGKGQPDAFEMVDSSRIAEMPAKA